MNSQRQRDESYVIDLCDRVLKRRGRRQHTFNFLCGDSGRRLPVDAFYPSLALVIEYRERQHTEAVKLFDERMTVSGISRGEQRRRYDERRRDVLPQHGLHLIELNCADFPCDRYKRLLRDSAADLKIIALKLRTVLPGR